MESVDPVANGDEGVVSLCAAAASAALACALMLVPSPVEAFCGAYVSGGSAELFNDATQVVMMRHEQTTVLSMQNTYEGPPENFAMIVPTPEVLEKENVKTIKDGVFDRIDRLTAPRLVEYWEQNPCEDRRYADGVAGQDAASAGAADTGGGGSGGGGGYVEVEAEFDVGEYEVVVLDSNDSSALDTWLRDNDYSIPSGAEQYLEPYIQQGSYFFVAKVDTEKVEFQDDEAVLSPLRFHYESPDFKLPVRLGLINSKGEQDLIANILAQNQRYDVANYPSTTIPTNIEVVSDVKNYFPSFYRELFSRALKEGREEGTNPVVTEYAWNASSCDPCPTGERLSQDDLYTLGGDVMADKYGSGGSNDDAGRPQPGRQFRRGWVVTRLHTRYGEDELGADLVFEEAEPIEGGRETTTNESGNLSQEPVSSSRNNFQGRYIIRHQWDGAVTCEDPEFGRWGSKEGFGSPNTETAKGETNRSSDDAPEDVRLEDEIRDDIDSLGVSSTPKQDDDGTYWNGPSGGTGSGAGSGSSGGATRSVCSTSGERPPAPMALFALAAFLVGWRRHSRRADGRSGPKNSR